MINAYVFDRPGQKKQCPFWNVISRDGLSIFTELSYTDPRTVYMTAAVDLSTDKMY